ncbi:hypothetical protein DL764_009055 [Monosporascus ibericus]|uniref:Uncharacterized protein n=1 Tax=Monosporascus ibericus TaxID=155417 RepID=A0A4V1X933_9PEZI|nr:hypothetical protein DL764_009055 [Monosporascus ibericus]
MPSTTTARDRHGVPPPRPRREINMDHSWADFSSDSSSGRSSTRRRPRWFARLLERLKARFGGRFRREVSEIVTRPRSSSVRR